MRDLAEVIGSGARMHAIRELIRAIALDLTPVIIVGEPGTGRHFIGRLIQELAGTTRSVSIAQDDGPGFADGKPAAACIRITLPPLRERMEDVPLLTDHFLAQAARAGGRQLRPVSPSARQALENYHWPLNVRELQRTCEWISRTCSCSSVKRGCLPARLQRSSAMPLGQPPRRVGLDEQLNDLEARLITRALMETGYNRSRAARLLTVKRSTLGDRIQRLGLAERIDEGVA